MSLAHEPRSGGAIVRLNPTLRASLRDFIEASEKREQRIKLLREATRDDIAVLKAKGFDPAALRDVLSMRKREAKQKPTTKEARDLYLDALARGN